MSDTSRVTISRGAAELLQKIAKANEVTPRQYVEALLHYAGSIHHRPGSWEANKPFDLYDYTGNNAGYADKWFKP